MAYVHTLAIFVVFIMPILSVFLARKAKINTNETRKQQNYLLVYLCYILATILVLTIYPLSAVFTPSSQFSPTDLINLALWGITGYVLLMLFAPALLVTFHAATRAATYAEYDKKAYMYPRTNRSLLMFTVLAFIVGITEEIIYRGFVYTYLIEYWNASAAVSFIVMSVLFGLGHFHQGKSAIVETFLFGLALGHLYFSTGSLLVPMIVHILYDLKIVYVSWVLRRHDKGARGE